MTACMVEPELISLEVLFDATTLAYIVGSIDDPKNLANSKVWLFSGRKDHVILRGVMEKVEGYYQNYVYNSTNVVLIDEIPAEHAWITSSYGNDCGYFGSPYMNNCHYDAAGQLLNFIYENLSHPINATSQILTFSQASYSKVSVEYISLSTVGYLYVPKNCQSGAVECKLHIFFHGCLQTADLIGTVLIQNSGLNTWAEANNIIVVYPQTTNSSFPYNPKACWDWWGYTGPQYATQLASQISFIENVINALVGSS